MIELTNVTMAYDADPVVRDVTLTLPDSGVTALIGPNGAGKSTLLSGIGRLHPLIGGSVRIDGRELGEWDTDALARTIAILRQENHLAIRLTVAELVMLGRHPHSKGRRTREDYAHVADALQCVNMRDLADRFIDELSGGQRQRTFIAMALAQDTKYLLLDEPLSALDMRHGRDMMRHLKGVCAERGISVVIVIHDVNTAAAYADRMVAMKDGYLACSGTPPEVMREDVLGEIFDVEVNVAELGGRLVAMPVA
ncbi:iron ABC transporter ATP-binding protein [Trueperella sp. HMSC08B05]|uniref:iron ABC transporter ATP-binding protein n=1 Tax=Trueperella sp. HMSC08B05 TaxID=1581135 RepID=UPI0008A52AAA|nr:ATP-binding cassette domain-containing protein [Trueperella sp. HMSC08B05]OFS72707.1 iron ABC transporter ATP-binding protein [Trueperella sp. HMSC08B05]